MLTSDLQMAYMFSLVTQQTIGYGNTGPNDCYWGSVVITAQTMIGLYDFSSFPHNRT